MLQGVEGLSAVVSGIEEKSSECPNSSSLVGSMSNCQNRPSPASALTWVRIQGNCWQDPALSLPGSTLCLNLPRFEVQGETGIRTTSCFTEHCVGCGL